MTLGCSSPEDVAKAITDNDVQMVDIRFTDLPGVWQHTSYPATAFGADNVAEGLGFDGSSIRGFQEIQASDMLLFPDPTTAFIDPFMRHKTLVLICNIHDPVTKDFYPRDPRGVARRAEEHLKTTGLGDRAYFGPEAEFFVFDDVRYGQDVHYGTYAVDSVEGHWNMAEDEGPNLGHKIRPKEGYFPVPPTDTLHDLRAEMALVMGEIGINVECHHHEVATGGQCEIDMRFDTLVSMADDLIKYKYVVKNVARAHGKTATFMPKPLFGDNGSGMHVHQSIWNGRHPDLRRCGRLCGAQRELPLLHRRPAQARAGDPGLRGAHHQLLPSPGAGLRGAGQPGLVPAQPLGRCAHPDVLRQPQGQARRVPLPRPVLQSLPGLLRHADGRASTGSRTGSIPATRSTRTSTTCRPRSWPSFPACRRPWKPPSTRWRPTTSSCSTATCSPRTSSTTTSATSARPRSIRCGCGPIPTSM